MTSKKLISTFLITTFMIALAGSPVFAFNRDIENTDVKNKFRASTLDIELDDELSGNDDIGEDLYPGEENDYRVEIQNVGLTDVHYNYAYSQTGGDTSFCEAVNLEIVQDSGSVTVYSGDLDDLNLQEILNSKTNRDYTWEFSLPPTAPETLSNESCEFTIELQAHQDGFLPNTGFYDNESIDIVLNAGDWEPPAVPTGLSFTNHKGTVLGCVEGITNNQSITLDWADNPESDIDYYEIEGDGDLGDNTPTASEDTDDLSSTDGTYQYRVRAVDTTGNIGDWSSYCTIELDQTLTDYDTLDVIINEIMWSGSTVRGRDEWIELYNDTGSTIDLGNWTIVNARGDANPIMRIPEGRSIAPGGYFLISNYNSTSSNSALADSITVDWRTNKIKLDNDGEQLTMYDALGNQIDQTPTGSWAAGENGSDKRSMERNNDPLTGWHSCIDPVCNDTTYWDTEGNNHGTPRSENHSENDPSSSKKSDDDSGDSKSEADKLVPETSAPIEDDESEESTESSAS